MKKLLFGAVCALIVAAPASAALIGDFQLNGSLANAVGGPVVLTNNGGTLGATGITFGVNQGPTISGTSLLTDYSVETTFRFDNTSGWRKILDFQYLTSDLGLYTYGGSLVFFPFASSGSVDFVPGRSVKLLFTRDSSGLALGYINNVQVLSFLDSGGIATISNVLHLFTDDNPTLLGEASSGFVDSIRIYNSAITGEVPEPASWAMMISGFGMIGATLRRRRAVAA